MGASVIKGATLRYLDTLAPLAALAPLIGVELGLGQRPGSLSESGLA